MSEVIKTSPSSCTVINSISLKFKGISRKKGTLASTPVSSDSAPHTPLLFSIKTVNTVSMKRWDWSKSHQGLQHVPRAFSVLESINFSEIKECSTSTSVAPKIFSKTRLISLPRYNLVWKEKSICQVRQSNILSWNSSKILHSVRSRTLH